MTKMRKIVSLYFVALFISYYAIINFFPHLHVISGATIIHSHIHTNAHHNTNCGGHTECGITLISLISHFDSIDFLFNSIPDPLQFLQYELNFVEQTHRVTSVHFQNLSLRAPPIV